MTPRLMGETQRVYVERTLREDGRVETYAVLYELVYEDGSKCSISRLAAIVDTLRKVGWDIETEQEHGQTATYILRGAKATVPTPLRPATRPVERPEWQRGWMCTSCGAQPVSPPESRLGGLAIAKCDRCGKPNYFRKRAAA